MEFARIIKGSTYEQRLYDRKIFRQWEEDELSTSYCIALFRRNHHYFYDLDEKEFMDWLNSLGYYNHETCNKIPTGCYRY